MGWSRQKSTDIGAILRISAGVVDEHILKCLQEIGVRTRTQAAIIASAEGWLI